MVGPYKEEAQSNFITTIKESDQAVEGSMKKKLLMKKENPQLRGRSSSP